MSQPDLSSQLAAAQARIAELEQALAVLEVVKPDLAAELEKMDQRVIYLAEVIADKERHIEASESSARTAYTEGRSAGFAAGREDMQRQMAGPSLDPREIRPRADSERYMMMDRQRVEAAYYAPDPRRPLKTYDGF